MKIDFTGGELGTVRAHLFIRLADVDANLLLCQADKPFYEALSDEKQHLERILNKIDRAALSVEAEHA